MPASVEDRMAKLGFLPKKPPETVPTEKSKPKMVREPTPSKPKKSVVSGSGSKSKKRSSKKGG
jgi:hypothetical protein